MLRSRRPLSRDPVPLLPRALPVAIGAVVASLALALGLYGIGRSLWLDEVWVANSIQAPSLSAMFYYRDWLQVNPPLFLLLARGASHVLGLSNISLRIVPLLLALASLVNLFAIARRVVSPAFAALACALLASYQPFIDYAHSFKPYAGELAGSTGLLLAAILYLERPTRRRYLAMLAVVALALPLGYATAFVLPGTVIATWFVSPASSRFARAATLAAAAGSILAILYFVFLRPNLSPDLRAFWAVDAGRVSPGLGVAVVFLLAAAARVMISIFRSRRPGPREWTQILCILPCFLLAVSGTLGLYPVSARTRLFAIPLFLLVAAITAEDAWLAIASRRLALNRSLTAVLLIGAVAAPAAALWSQIQGHRNLPEEDLEGAVRFLARHAAPDELIVVHAECREGFRFYAARLGWRPARVVFGDTGWPCCARAEPSGPGNSRRTLVLANLDALIPRGYTGRLWMLYSTRPTQWSYTGLDEGKLWRSHVWASGCPPGPYYAFANLAVTPMNCAGYTPAP